MKVATAIRAARRRARLSKRALARRARTSPAAIVLYESGERDPTVSTLQRIVEAAGATVDLVVAPAVPRPDAERAGRVLAEVLELAEHLPRRRNRRALTFPPLPS